MIASPVAVNGRFHVQLNTRIYIYYLSVDPQYSIQPAGSSGVELRTSTARS